MSTMTDEILDKISDYKREDLDAEYNVIVAYMEATMRDITIRSECEEMGIYMEGGIIPKKDDDENIFLYILLFIPRLILNLMKKLRELITGVEEPDPIELAKAEALAKEISEGDRFGNIIANNMNDAMANKAPTIKCEFAWDGSQYICRWGLHSVDRIRKLYETYSDFFKAYAETFKMFFEGANVNSETIGRFDILLDVLATGGDFVGAYQDDLRYIVTSKTIMEYYNFLPELTRMSQDIEASMNSIKRYYEKMEHKSRKYDNIGIIKGYMDRIHIVIGRFENENSHISISIDKVTKMFGIIPKLTKNALKAGDADKETIKKFKERGLV